MSDVYPAWLVLREAELVRDAASAVVAGGGGSPGEHAAYAVAQAAWEAAATRFVFAKAFAGTLRP